MTRIKSQWLCNPIGPTSLSKNIILIGCWLLLSSSFFVLLLSFLLFPFIIYQFSSENEKMVARARGGARLQCLSLFIVIHFLVVSANFFKPFNVSYDHRALIIDGQRRMLISGGIHYPRATPEVLEFYSFLFLLDHFSQYPTLVWLLRMLLSRSRRNCFSCFKLLVKEVISVRNFCFGVAE